LDTVRRLPDPLRRFLGDGAPHARLTKCG
jgi:hypothetical protein